MNKSERAKKVQELMNAKFPVTIGSIAKALDCSCLEAAKELPEGNASFVDGSEFKAVWEELCTWEGVTLIVQHKGNVFEITCRLASGKEAMGFYNIMGNKSSFGGHLKIDRYKEIGFISLPFMGRESHFVAFFDDMGDEIFSVYVGRENHKLIESAKESFLALQAKYRD